MMAKAIQILGTGSGVGKSVIAAGLCRIFLQDGYRVCPFKAQNMALNSFVTEDGGEIGRSQAVQAKACKIKPTVDMNPVLIKPTSNTKAQIILKGRPVKNMNVYEYKSYKKLVFGRIKESFRKLSEEYEIVVIEGAGSPAEINLKSHDLVNMRMARFADASVILIGDIDRGGVFAWLIGTWQLLSESEREMVRGFIINKFRGDRRLLRSGIRFLEKYTGVKVLGVVPYFNNIRIPEEDSLDIKLHKEGLKSRKKIKVDVITLPHISNFTDFDALEQESDVSLRYIKKPEEFGEPDIIIIPGTKNTIDDLDFLKKSGVAERIITLFNSSKVYLIGLCGGYQILGDKIYDKKNIESRKREIKGLGILPIVTEIHPEKVLSQVNAEHIESKIKIKGYEIHHGRTRILKSLKPMFRIIGRKTLDGAAAEDGRCWGTYIHGVFDSDEFRRYFLNSVRESKGWKPLEKGINYDVDKEIDKLACLLRENINMGVVYKILTHR